MHTYVQDSFEPAKHLPVHITNDGMELLESTLSKSHVDGHLFVEIGSDMESTCKELSAFIETHFTGVLGDAFEEECEFINFFI